MGGWGELNPVLFWIFGIVLTLQSPLTTTVSHVVVIVVSTVAAKMMVHVVVSADYPNTPPLMVVCINWKMQRHNLNDENVRVRLLYFNSTTFLCTFVMIWFKTCATRRGSGSFCHSATQLVYTTER